MVIVSKFFVPKGYRAIALFPFIFLLNEKDRQNKMLINHEKIHLAQQKELLVIFFYLWYFLDFLRKYLKYKNWDQAYRNIIFEREAYQNERNLNYLKQRRFWGFISKKTNNK